MLEKVTSYLLRNQIVLAIFIIAVGWFVIQIKGILVAIFIAYILMASLIPFVNYLQEKKFPKILAVLIPYLGILVTIFLIVVPVLLPFFVQQVQSLLSGFPFYLKQSTTELGITIDQDSIQEYISSELANIGRNAFAVTSRVFSGLISTFTILIVGFYLLMYHDNFKKWLARLFPKRHRERVILTFQQVDDKLGAWFRGQIVLMLFIGFLTWIALTILGMPDALSLAFIAGVLEILPTLGPTLAAVPAVIIALTVSPQMAIIVIIIYVLIQQIENNFLVPKIMQKAVGLNPVVVILGIMVGANLMGIAGALLAIPFISFVIVLFQSLRGSEQQEE